MLPAALAYVREQLKEIGARRVEVRQCSSGKAGPVVTDNGNIVLDADFADLQDPRRLERDINAITGVIECGIFCGLVSRLYVGTGDGNVTKRDVR